MEFDTEATHAAAAVAEENSWSFYNAALSGNHMKMSGGVCRILSAFLASYFFKLKKTRILTLFLKSHAVIGSLGPLF